MVDPRCPVRGCGAPVSLGGSATCTQGHRFDRAREGYWSLVQPQDRRSPAPGDGDAAVRARRRIADRGLLDRLATALAELVPKPIDPPELLDVGCGEGTVTARLASALGVDATGIDLSETAVRLSARRAQGARIIRANADRGLPFADRSFGLVTSVTGPKPLAELGRVSARWVVVVVPGPGDLAEVRAAVHGSATEHDYAGALLTRVPPALTLEGRARHQASASADPGLVEDALVSTYRGQRAGAAPGLAAEVVTLCWDLLLFERR